MILFVVYIYVCVCVCVCVNLNGITYVYPVIQRIRKYKVISTYVWLTMKFNIKERNASICM
jgi:hypothetical protein